MNWKRTNDPHTKQLAIRTFKKYYGCHPNLFDTNRWNNSEWVQKVIGVYKKTRVLCSSPWCCGNPRKIKGRKKDTIPIKELKQIQSMKEELEEQNN